MAKKNWFSKKNKPEEKTENKEFTIQANVPEGLIQDVQLTSLLTGNIVTGSVKGLTNSYKNYNSQVLEIYKKYNGESDWGNAQTRALVDIRAAFIAGEGISISVNSKKESTSKFLEEFKKFNLLDGLNFLNWVKGGELSGQVLLQNKLVDVGGKTMVKVIRRPYYPTYPNNYIAKRMPNSFDIHDVSYFYVQKDNLSNEEKIMTKDFVYIPLGGDDLLTRGPTPKIGIILTELENYDRALKDMRLNNHIMARITPVITTKSKAETKDVKAFLNETKWKIGTAFIGTADFRYETPGTGAHDNLKSEMASTLKSISAVSGMPVHWLGWVDMMSNRSTADSLFEFINNATITDRVLWQSKLYELMVMAQVMYIDKGGPLINEVDLDFEVKIPLINFNEFKSRVEALSMAFHDGAISMDDYRNYLPGVDPQQTAKAIKNEEKEQIKRLVLTSPNPGLDENKNKRGEDNDRT